MTDADLARLRSVFRRYVATEAEVEAVFRGVPILAAITIDSLGLVHLITDVENEFAVRFDYASIDVAFENLESLTAFIDREAGG